MNLYFFVRGLLNNFVTLSWLYAKFRWLISRVQLTFQTPSLNVLHRLTDSRGYTAVPQEDLIRHRHRRITSIQFPTLRNYGMIGQRTRGVHSASTRRPLGVHSASTRRPLGVHSASTRRPLGVHSASTRRPLGVHSASTRRCRVSE